MGQLTRVIQSIDVLQAAADSRVPADGAAEDSMRDSLTHFNRPDSPSIPGPNNIHKRPASVDAVLMFLIFAAAGVLIALSSLDAPFFWDDLHLIRVQTPSELAGGWSGPWDPDRLEHPGLRPLTMYFDYVRATVFGESVVGHRLFLIAVFAVFLTLAGLLARALFSAGLWQVSLGGLFGLLHVDSVTHYLWPTDGIFLVTGSLTLGALLAFVRAWKSGRLAWLALAFTCTALALFTREDSLVIYPLMVWFGGMLALDAEARRSVRTLGAPAMGMFAAASFLVLIGFWWWRAAAVPDAIEPRIDIEALLWAAAHTVQNAGTSDRLLVPWPRYEMMITVWYVWLAAVAAAALAWLDRPGRRALLCWGVVILISAAPAMVVARANLLLLPAAFWGLLLANVLACAWSRARHLLWRGVISGLILVGVALPALGSYLFQQELRPSNLQWMCRNALILYDVVGEASVPAARRAAVQEQLDSFGISGAEELGGRWRALERVAQAEGRYGVNAQQEPFIPRFEFLPQFRLHPRCEPPR